MMFLTTNLIFHVAIFNVFIVIITGLKYPLDYQRRVATRRPIARVVDGEDADRLEYVYVVALERFPGDYIPSLNFTKYRLCTGTLINTKFVISAAHCSEEADRIRYGDLTVPSSSTRASHSNIARKFLHPQCELHMLVAHRNPVYVSKNDIALYKVEPVNLPKYAHISAVDYKTFTGLPVYYVGLGSSHNYLTNESEAIKRIVEDETRERQIGYAVVKPCGKFLSTALVYPLICLARKCNSNQVGVSGDSGGPLLYDGKIIGVFRGYEATDGTKILQATYTPVSVYLDWITHVVNTEN